MDAIIGLAFAVGALAGSWGLGQVLDRRHLSSLDEREQMLGHILVTQFKNFPGYAHGSGSPQLVMGEAVLAVDYFKSFLYGLRSIFGGESRSLQALLDRARREATLRMLQQAERQGYNAVCNVRYASADIGAAKNAKNQQRMATILVIGTAYHAQ